MATICAGLLFITSNHTFQKWIDFDTIQRRFPDRNLIHEDLCDTSNFFLYPALFKWFLTVFCAMFSSWAIDAVLAWRSDFHYFIDIFVKFSGTESTKPKLLVIECYSIRIINTLHITQLSIVWARVFLARNLVVLMTYSGTQSHLYNAKYRLLKPSTGKIMHLFLLGLILYNSSKQKYYSINKNVFKLLKMYYK